MATTSRLTAEAAGNAMTLNELEAFIERARHEGATGVETPTVRIRWGGLVQRIAVDVTSEGEPALVPGP